MLENNSYFKPRYLLPMLPIALVLTGCTFAAQAELDEETGEPAKNEQNGTNAIVTDPNPVKFNPNASFDQYLVEGFSVVPIENEEIVKNDLHIYFDENEIRKQALLVSAGSDMIYIPCEYENFELSDSTSAVVASGKLKGSDECEGINFYAYNPSDLAPSEDLYTLTTKDDESLVENPIRIEP